MNTKVYPRTNDFQTVYLNTVIKNPAIMVGDYTIYNDFVNDPVLFEKNNVLYHYPINKDRLIIGKFCSIACGAKFLFNSANHTLNSLSNYPFPIFFEECVPGTVLMVRNAMELVRLRSRDASIVIPVLIHLHGGLHPGFLKLSFL